AALQVEMGEMPLEERRMQLKMTYWVSLKGHNSKHPTKAIFEDCWEHERTKIKSIGWIAEEIAQKMDLVNRKYSDTVPIAVLPPWLFKMPAIDLYLLKVEKSHSGIINEVNNYIERMYYGNVHIYTDGSKDPESNKTGIAVAVPQQEIIITKRTPDYLSVFTTELIAIVIALQWLEETQIQKAVICSDSLAALKSIKSGQSNCRQDIIIEIMQLLYRIHVHDRVVSFLWVPAHVGIDGNEMADKNAKRSLNKNNVEIDVKISKAEAKIIIKQAVTKFWQQKWDMEKTGRHLYNIQKKVGLQINETGSDFKRREEVIITRLRLGHSSLNGNLHKIRKHPSGFCRFCGETETVEHILLQCRAYNKEIQMLKTKIQTEGANNITLELILGNRKFRRLIIKYIIDTGNFRRI
ncbi:MAG: ribonuclease H family protein, partial [Aeromonas sp.]